MGSGEEKIPNSRPPPILDCNLLQSLQGVGPIPFMSPPQMYLIYGLSLIPQSQSCNEICHRDIKLLTKVESSFPSSFPAATSCWVFIGVSSFFPFSLLLMFAYFAVLPNRQCFSICIPYFAFRIYSHALKETAKIFK